jgi:hypothetical protein
MSRKKIGIGAGFDLLAHQAGGPEFRRCDRVGARGKAADEIGAKAVARLPAPITCSVSARAAGASNIREIKQAARR